MAATTLIDFMEQWWKDTENSIIYHMVRQREIEICSKTSMSKSQMIANSAYYTATVAIEKDIVTLHKLQKMYYVATNTLGLNHSAILEGDISSIINYCMDKAGCNDNNENPYDE